MNLGLKAKTAIVLAASKGLGKASATALAREGANVVIGSRNKVELERTTEQIIKETGSRVLSVLTDVTQLKDLETIISKTIDEFNSIDVLVTNAGGPPPGNFESLTDEQWQQAFELNLLSTVRVIKLALPYLKKSKNGRIINMVSISAKQPYENLILSNSIRAGVLGMAKTLADEIAKDDITVNNVLTGSFLTDRVRKLHKVEEKIKKGMTEEEALSEQINNIPLKRLGKPEEYGNLVAFLASEQASFITGTSIQIDGGYIRSLY